MSTSKGLEIDLQRGVVPISAAAMQLAKLIKRAGNTPIVITRKGSPAAVLISIEDVRRA